jgi:hypothetical protein
VVEHGAQAAALAEQGSVTLRQADLTDAKQVTELLSSAEWSLVAVLPSEERSLVRVGLTLVTSLLSLGAGQRPPAVWFVSTGALPVDASSSMQSAASARQAWLSGFVKTLGVEHAELGVRHVDVASVDDLGRLLDGSSALPGMEAEVAVRGPRVFVPRLTASKASLSAAGKMHVRPDGTYVITGGLGALGLVFAERLVEEGAGAVVLLSRSGEAGSGPAAEALGRLRASKARVEVVKCDVSQGSSVQEMFRAVGVSLPPVRGVLHSAGVLDDATIENQTVEKFERVFSSKVDGAWHLHDASAELGLELDFFVLFSSISSLLGSPGQSNYAAANAA